MNPSESVPTPPAGHDESSFDDPAPSPPAVLVVRHPERSSLARLTPPLLILLTALVITSYQRKAVIPLSAYRSDLAEASRPSHPPISDAPAAPAEPEAIVLLPDDPPPPPAPLVVLPENVVATTPTAEPAAEPAPDSKVVEVKQTPSPFDLDANEGLRPVAITPAPERLAAQSPPATSDASAGPNATLLPEAADLPKDSLVMNGDPVGPPVSKDDILDDIQRESDQKDANQLNMQDLKPRAQAMLLAEAVGRVQSSRSSFHTDLKKAIEEFGPNAGQEIERIAQKYGREMPPEVKTITRRADRTMPTRITLTGRIEFYRKVGVPEPAILDLISHRIHKEINTRGGPRDEHEVRVRAAQLLLSLPRPAAGAPGTPP